ncbi:hypothetical protein ES705_20138 [subsurface metagenome]
MSGFSTSLKLSLKNIGLKEGGRLSSPSEGREVIRSGIPITAPARIPISIAPCILNISRTPIILKPASVIQIVWSDKFPILTRVFSSAIIRPELMKPIRAINKPMPTEMACFNGRGILFTISSRMLKAVSSIKIIPSIKIAVSAVCQE